MSNSKADRLARQIHSSLTSGCQTQEAHDALGALAALAKQQASPDAQPVARLLHFTGKDSAKPFGGTCARTFAEFPKGEGEKPEGCWREGAPLYTSAPQCEQVAAAVAANLAEQARRAGGDPVEIWIDKADLRIVLAALAQGTTPVTLPEQIPLAPEFAAVIAKNRRRLFAGTTPAAGVGEQATGGWRPTENADCGLDGNRCSTYIGCTAFGCKRAPKPAQAEPMSNARIIEIANGLFPRWQEDIQVKFVLMLSRAILAEAGIKEKT